MYYDLYVFNMCFLLLATAASTIGALLEPKGHTQKHGQRCRIAYIDPAKHRKRQKETDNIEREAQREKERHVQQRTPDKETQQDTYKDLKRNKQRGLERDKYLNNLRE